MPVIRKRFLQIGERRVHYLRSGEGPCVVLVHSSPASADQLRPLIGRLAESQTCFAFDTPGFGSSEALTGEVTIPRLADALAAAMQALGLPACPVFGTHTGAAIALELGVRHPERVTGLVLDGVPIFRPEELAVYEGYFAPLRVDPLGGHFAHVWTRFRDQSTWFPWTSRDPRDLNPFPLQRPKALHANLLQFFRCAASYAPVYEAAVRSGSGATAAASALTTPAVYTARAGDMLEPHLDRLAQLKPGQSVRRIGSSTAERDAVVVDGLAAWPARGATPGDVSHTVRRADAIAVGYLDLPDGQLFVRSAGGPGKPAMLLLHDAPGSGLSLEPVMAALGEHFNVVAPDLPGCGESDPLPAGASLADIAACVDGLARALDLGPATLYGLGFGAGLAVEVAARFPERVRGLLLQGMPLPTAAERADLQAHFAPPIEVRPDGGHWYALWLQLRDSLIWFPWHQPTPANQRRVRADFDPERLHAWTVEVMKQAQGYAQLIHAVLAADLAARVAKLDLPIAVCRDPRTPFSAHDRRLAGLAPGAPELDPDPDPVALAAQLATIAADFVRRARALGQASVKTEHAVAEGMTDGL